MAKYIKHDQVVDIDYLTDTDMEAIKWLMPDFHTQILNCGKDYWYLYIIRDGVNIKIISKDVLEEDYTEL